MSLAVYCLFLEREVGPGAVLAGSIVQGRRLAEAKGRDIYDDESDTAKKYQYLGDILRWRATTSPDHVLYTVINSKVRININIIHSDNNILKLHLTLFSHKKHRS